jgi:hypothetical protein
VLFRSNMTQLDFSRNELRDLDKALQLLRDRHYRNFHNAKDSQSPTALEQYAIYQKLEQLRFRIREA